MVLSHQQLRQVKMCITFENVYHLFDFTLSFEVCIYVIISVAVTLTNMVIDIMIGYFCGLSSVLKKKMLNVVLKTFSFAKF